MKKPPIPSPETKLRLQKLGEGAIADFIGEISDLKRFVQYLPTVPGFRKNSKAGIDRQRKELARRLCSRANRNSGPQDRDYRSLYTIWRAWVEEKLGERRAIDSAIDAIEEASGGPDSNTRAKNVETAAIALFTLFKKYSEEGKCSREDIERAFQFSLFDESEPLRAVIESSRLAADITRNAEYEGLPNRLRKDEDDINTVKTQLKELAQCVERLAAAVDGWAIYRIGLSSAIDDLRVSIERRLEALESAGPGTSAQVPDNRDVGAPPGDKALIERIEDIERQFAGFPVDKWNIATEAAERALKRFDTIEETLARLENQTISDVAGRTAGVEERLDREIKIRLSGTTDPSVLERLDKVEEALVRHPPPQPLSEAKGLPHNNAVKTEGNAAVLVEALPPRAGTASAIASDLSGITAPLSSMFQDLGLKPSAAKVLAEEICAALLVGQVVFLKGSYATEAARASASLLCNGNAYRLALPLGIQRADDLRQSIQSEVVVNDQLLAAVAIEGINLAAFEICKDVLAELVNDQPPYVAGGLGSTFVIATIVHGVASLPLEASYFELGPVFDLDCLDWRSRRPVARDTPWLALSKSAVRMVRATLTAKTIDAAEPQKLVQSFLPKRNPRIEHTVLSAFTALAGCRKEGAFPTPLQSLTYGWLLPLWNVQRVAKSEADIQIDGGKCDAAEPDPRLKLLLDELGAGPEKERS